MFLQDGVVMSDVMPGCGDSFVGELAGFGASVPAGCAGASPGSSASASTMGSGLPKTHTLSASANTHTIRCQPSAFVASQSALTPAKSCQPANGRSSISPCLTAGLAWARSAWVSSALQWAVSNKRYERLMRRNVGRPGDAKGV